MSRKAVASERWKTRVALETEVRRTAEKTPWFELRALEEGFRVARYNA